MWSLFVAEEATEFTGMDCGYPGEEGRPLGFGSPGAYGPKAEGQVDRVTAQTEGEIVMRPKYRVIVAIEVAVEVHATSASGASQTAQDIAREMIHAKGLKAGNSSITDLQRIYPPEDRESLVEAMSQLAKENE